MNLTDFYKKQSFAKSRYEVEALLHDTTRLPLLSLEIPSGDEQGLRHLANVTIVPELQPFHRQLVISSLIRAGARHPGLRDEDLVRLHGVAREARHIELFTDLNALSTGLLVHVVQSLGRHLARVVISSSSIDVLHEYQSKARRADDGGAPFLKRAEMVRALRLLEELRRIVPVHVHQLPPGATRYFQRGAAQPRRADVEEVQRAQDSEEVTYISEDRQMVAAFWNYVTTSNSRLPTYLVTSDFALAHVCAAERLPFLFAKTAHAIWIDSATTSLETLWFDPFSLTLRFCAPHTILWELCLVYGRLNIRQVGGDDQGFGLTYELRAHLPGESEDIAYGELSEEPPEPPPAGGTRSKGERKIKLNLRSLLEVLPTRLEQRVPLVKFKPKDEDSLRQLKQIGEVTGLYSVDRDEVSAGPSLAAFLDGLGRRDYVAVNRIFRTYSAYDQLLTEAAAGTPFPGSKQAGALTGWAVLLGAAYKQKNGVLYGLAEISDEEFAAAVIRSHEKLGAGQPSVPLPSILNDVCVEQKLAPIRFEALLDRMIGRGPLKDYEAQRATVDEEIPVHPVLIGPSEQPENYIRNFAPGHGLVLDGKLVAALVRLPGAA